MDARISSGEELSNNARDRREEEELRSLDATRRTEVLLHYRLLNMLEVADRYRMMRRMACLKVTDNTPQTDEGGEVCQIQQLQGLATQQEGASASGASTSKD